MSTLLHLDSCDHYDSATSSSKWSSAVTIVSGGRNGQCLRGTGSKLFPLNTTITVGAAVYLTGLVSAELLSLHSSVSGVSVTLSIMPDATLKLDFLPRSNLAAGQTVVYTDNPTPIRALGWFYLEAQFTHASFDSSPDYDTLAYDIRVNEETVMSGTINQNIASPWKVTTAGFTYATLHGITFLYDDIYITDTEFLGDVSVDVLHPSADTATVQWSVSSSPAGDHYVEVDEDVLDGDTSYISTETVDAIDLVELEDLGDVGDIKGIQFNAVVEKAAVGTGSIAHYCNISSTDVESASVFYPNYLSYQDFRYPLRKNPITTNDFSIAEVNAIQQGVKRKS